MKEGAAEEAEGSSCYEYEDGPSGDVVKVGCLVMF